MTTDTNFLERLGMTEDQQAEFAALVNDIHNRLALPVANFSSGSSFNLDGLENRIPLTPDEHAGWDRYGQFALVPRYSQLFRYLGALLSANARWKSPGEKRSFTSWEHSALEAPVNWVVLLLRPWAFLPPDETLWMSGTHDPTIPSSGRAVHTSPTDPSFPFLLDADNKVLNDGFIVPSTWGAGSELSLFAMIANAYSKVRAALRSPQKDVPVHKEVRQYFDVLDNVMRQIMFTPATPTGDSNVSAGSIEVDLTAAPGPSPETRAAAGDAPPGPSLPPSPALPFPNPYSKPDLGPPPERPDGLTLAEMRILLARSSDGQLAPADRVDATMLLLFGNGRTNDSDEDSDGTSGPSTPGTDDDIGDRG